MTIKKFDNTSVDGLLKDIQMALEMVAEEHGLKLKRKRCTYDVLSCPTPFEFIIVNADADGNEVTPESEKYKQQCHLYGLKPEWLFKTFTSRGHTFKIIGLKTRNRKFPVIAMRDDGESMKLGEQMILQNRSQLEDEPETKAISLTPNEVKALQMMADAQNNGTALLPMKGQKITANQIPVKVAKSLAQHKFALTLDGSSKNAPVCGITREGVQRLAVQ